MTLALPWPRGLQATINYGGRITTTSGTNVVSGGTAHNLSSSFTDLIASTTHDVHMLSIMIHNTGAAATRTDALLNIYVGAASSEVLLIDSIAAGWVADATASAHKWLRFPIYIPAGTRISAKTRSLQTSKDIYVMVRAEGWSQPPLWCGRGVETIGHNTASSTGTSVTPGTTSEGTFTSIATTTNEWNYIMVIAHGLLADTNTTARGYFVDVGSGSAVLRGLENDFQYNPNASEMLAVNGDLATYCKIPAGTAIQLRAQVSDATAEATDFIVYGVYG